MFLCHSRDSRPNRTFAVTEKVWACDRQLTPQKANHFQLFALTFVKNELLGGHRIDLVCHEFLRMCVSKTAVCVTGNLCLTTDSPSSHAETRQIW
jgi:hypothetical protein